MSNDEPKKGETVSEYLKRYFETHNKLPTTEPIISHLTYKFNNIKTKEDCDEFIKITKCEFKTYDDKEMNGITSLDISDRKITFTLDYQPMDPKFVNWIGSSIKTSEPKYECTGVAKDHKYRMKTYAPKLKRMLR